MYERGIVEENNQTRETPPMTRAWGLIIGICTAPLFIIFVYLGDPGRGRAAWVSAIVISAVIRFFWTLRKQTWFWVAIVIIVLLHVPLVLLIPWGDQSLSYVALLPIGFLDFCITYGIIKLVRNTVKAA